MEGGKGQRAGDSAIDRRTGFRKPGDCNEQMGDTNEVTGPPGLRCRQLLGPSGCPRLQGIKLGPAKRWEWWLVMGWERFTGVDLGLLSCRHAVAHMETLVNSNLPLQTGHCCLNGDVGGKIRTKT